MLAELARLESSVTPLLPLKDYLYLMVLSREADQREHIMFKQGRGKFHLPSAGHEAVGAIAYAIESDDIVYPYYRDRALMLARGTKPYQLALDYLAKKNSSSGGRQMSSHFSDHEHHMVSCATPTGLQCLPSVGTAWGFKLAGKSNIVICCIGDAATRQGEFYEALCFALQEKLPIVFVVEDNGYGVSTATNTMTPYNILALAKEHCKIIDGRDPEAIFDATAIAVEKARTNGGPTVLWLELDRLMSHTSSDDQRIYRLQEELLAMAARDPIQRLYQKLVTDGQITENEWLSQCHDIKENVRSLYERAELEEDPEASEVKTHIFSDIPLIASPFDLTIEKCWDMVDAVNASLRHLLATNHRVILFGEDIEDPKGGVFGLTKKLSRDFPEQVFNSPLAEATIGGIAPGLALAGYMPIFELQFIDFVGPAFNQLVNQIATLRWRTMGRYKCPLVILAPCGGYFGGGGPWHSQTNESWFAHAPGLRVLMPSTPQDAADLICSAAMGDDPVLILLPKNLFRKKIMSDHTHSLYPDHANICRFGNDITVVAWGNCVDIALSAAKELEPEGISAEIIDIRSIVPCDLRTITHSLIKTGRLVIIQEDNRTCSFGQALISDLTADNEVWKRLKSPPKLVCRDDVHIGFHFKLEKAVLPDKNMLIKSIKESMVR